MSKMGKIIFGEDIESTTHHKVSPRRPFNGASTMLRFSKNLAVFHVDMDHLERKASSGRGIWRSYDASYKLAVVRYAKTTTNREAGRKFGLDESNEAWIGLTCGAFMKFKLSYCSWLKVSFAIYLSVLEDKRIILGV
ncbi:hypothetical protein C0J52_14400 [Blattella germanica]|nr:hypothetical protein C0J52_14400 [Blattella germanica]